MELAPSEDAAAIVAEVRANYSYTLDEPSPLVPSDSALQPSQAEKLVWDGTAWLAVLPHELAPETRIIRVQVGARASDGFVVTDVGSGLAVHATLRGSTGVEPAFVDGYAVYPDALEAADVVHRFSAGGVEDFVVLREPPRTPALRYAIELGGAVAGLRMVGRTVEFLQEDGTPRLRVAPPYVVDADGRWFDAELAIEGCAFDTDPRGPWGRPVVDPGTRHCELVVSWPDERLTYPLLVDPAWQWTSDMATRRWWHGAETLPDGRVLVFGGNTLIGSSGATNLCEIWNPAGESWAATDSMDNTRYAFGWTTVTAGGVNFVLAAGGYGNCTGSFCDKAERFRTLNAMWEPAGVMPNKRIDFPLVRVNDGTGRAFAIGGQNGASFALAAVDSYNPNTNGWTAKDAMNASRKGAAAVAFALVSGANKRIVVVGGRNNQGTYLSSGDFYEPVPEPQLGSWIATNSDVSVRYGHTLTLAPNDIPIAIGGETNAGFCTKTNSMYSWGGNSWSEIAEIPDPQPKRCYHAATLRDNGTIVVSGGKVAPTGTTNKSHIYDPVFNTWSGSYTMVSGRDRHTATLYPHTGPIDRVLVAGGREDFLNTVFKSAEYLIP